MFEFGNLITKHSLAIFSFHPHMRPIEDGQTTRLFMARQPNVI